MELKPIHGIIILLLGFGGLFFVLVDSNSQIGSKLPLVMFFLIILIIGIILNLLPRSLFEDTFGEPPVGIKGVKRNFG